VTTDAVGAREPDLIIGWWYGKKFSARADCSAAWFFTNLGCAVRTLARDEIVP
jgi:hypothetical protein